MKAKVKKLIVELIEKSKNATGTECLEYANAIIVYTEFLNKWQSLYEDREGDK